MQTTLTHPELWAIEATADELEAAIEAQGIEDLKAAIEAAAEELAAMPTRDLIDRAMSAPGCNTLTVALIDRLERYIDALDGTDDALRAAGLMPPKKPGKVIDLRTRQTLE